MTQLLIQRPGDRASSSVSLAERPKTPEEKDGQQQATLLTNGRKQPKLLKVKKE